MVCCIDELSTSVENALNHKVLFSIVIHWHLMKAQMSATLDSQLAILEYGG